ncbi:MAG TPA: glycosyltransferase [Polyangiaceae bacterium]|nr:glycosyltransferase [Polyangiaceae bacterium]
MADSPPPDNNLLAQARADLKVALVGTYPPRRCGIATFTRDLEQAMSSADAHVTPFVLAMTDPGGQYEYPENVKYEIRQAVKGDYARAAEFVNYSDVQLVSVQHEYGIFGGDDGAYILDFLTTLRVPAMVTLHTVLKSPSPSQRAIVQQLSKRSAGLVVLSRVAAELLQTSYSIDAEQIHMIAHGIPPMQPVDRQLLKAGFGVSDRRMLLTFGLLGPSKGIETVIRALPALIERFPDLVYFVVGATHPAIVRKQGEAYRSALEQEAEKLNVREHVVFHNQFVSTDDLCRYLQAADIFISPYLNEAQVTSGALSYAMGAGAAAVSTPYWHAQELLGDGRGRLFPFGDSNALAKELGILLESPEELRRVRQAAHDFTRSMLWPQVGKAHLELGKSLISRTKWRGRAVPRTRASSLPEVRLDHLYRLTDDTGILQHATFTVPARRSGYCVDDNARALIVALEADRLSGSPETAHLVTTYLGYLHHAQRDDGHFDNLMAYDRSIEPSIPSDDCLGRAIWALGQAACLATEEGHRRLARQMLERALPLARNLGPRGTALTLLGLATCLVMEPSHKAMRALLDELTEKLLAQYQREADTAWRWFEGTLTYDNALLPLSLFQSYGITGERASLRVARESLEFLEEVCFEDGRLVLVGNSGWHARGNAQKPPADEQATDAAAFVLAFRGAFLATGDHHHLRRMREAFAWFLGSNRLNLPLYDFTTAGCHDGLGASEVNRNEGAESTVAFLMSLQRMHELVGEGLEHSDDPPRAIN